MNPQRLLHLELVSEPTDHRQRIPIKLEVLSQLCAEVDGELCPRDDAVELPIHLEADLMGKRRRVWELRRQELMREQMARRSAPERVECTVFLRRGEHRDGPESKSLQEPHHVQGVILARIDDDVEHVPNL